MGKKFGFTIVELLIVIVVIGILASITIVAYSGIQNRAYDATIKSDLRNIATAFQAYRAFTGSYPVTEADIGNMDSVEGVNPRVSRGAYDVTSAAAPDDLDTSRNILICKREGVAGAPDPAFGIAALSKSGNIWFYTSDGGLEEYNGTWRGQQSATCPLLGIDLTDDGYARWYGYVREHTVSDLESGWVGWAAK